MLEINKIYQGSCLNWLKNIDNESIDCVITSPPYWALRIYQTEPEIWDGDKNCEHK
jgi:DNA modification methylase